MNSLIKTLLASVSVCAVAVSSAQAQSENILNITSGTPGNFGATAGIGIDYGAHAAPTFWSQGAPVNGQSYFIDSFSVIKNNEDSTFENLWVGVYDAFSNNGLTEGDLGNFLGASAASQAWGAGETGETFTWTFDNLIFEAAEDQQLFFLFQESADARTTKLTVGEGEIQIQRLDGNNNIANFGAAIINGGPAPGAGFQSLGRVPLTTVGISTIPEPGTYAALFGLVALGVVALRRRSHVS